MAGFARCEGSGDHLCGQRQQPTRCRIWGGFVCWWRDTQYLYIRAVLIRPAKAFASYSLGTQWLTLSRNHWA